jgi:hypothetical protein
MADLPEWAVTSGALDVTDRAGRLLGQISAAAGALFDVSDRAARLLGVADVSDRAARLLGVADVSDRAARLLGIADVSDRAARLLGVEQGGLADTLIAAGSATNPGAGAGIVAIAGVPAGVYSAVCVTFETGTADGSASNMRLQHGAGPTVVGSLSSTALAVQQIIERVTIAAGETVAIAAAAAGGVAATYNASLALTRIG